jgi:hypothetical protein
MHLHFFGIFVLCFVLFMHLQFFQVCALCFVLLTFCLLEPFAIVYWCFLSIVCLCSLMLLVGVFCWCSLILLASVAHYCLVVLLVVTKLLPLLNYTTLTFIGPIGHCSLVLLLLLSCWVFFAFSFFASVACQHQVSVTWSTNKLNIFFILFSYFIRIFLFVLFMFQLILALYKY